MKKQKSHKFNFKVKLFISSNISLIIILISFVWLGLGFSTMAQETQTTQNTQTQIKPAEMPNIEPTKNPSILWDILPSFVTQPFDDRFDKPIPSALTEQKSKSEELSIFLDGKSGYINVPHSLSLNISTKFTIEAWVRPTETGKSLGIIEKYENGVGGFSLSIAPEGVLQFSAEGENETVSSFYGQTIIPVNSWHHVAVTVTAKSVSVYLDGKMEGRQELEKQLLLNTADLTIGLTQSENNKKAFFSGLIDDVLITNTVKYLDNFEPESTLRGGGILGLKAACWRFSDQKLDDSTGNNNHGVIVGNVSFSKEVNDNIKTKDETQNNSKELSPQALINFDNLSIGAYLHNAYSGVSFYENNGTPMFAWRDNCQFGSILTTCGGQSYPNAARATYPTTPVTFIFDQPANISSFEVLAVDNYYGFITQGSMKQDGNWYYFDLYSNGQDVPVNVYINQFTCGPDPCNRVTQIVIYNIQDPDGFVYDDFNYTASTTPSPSPPCFSGKENDSLLPPCQPTPTPTPGMQPPPPPTNVVLKEDKGEVKITWDAGIITQNQPPADIYYIYRSDSSNGANPVLVEFVTYIRIKQSFDRDPKLRIDTTRYYFIKAQNQYGESAPSAIVSGKPLSACFDPNTNTQQPPSLHNFNGFGWTGTYKFEHGFSATNVALNNRLMAVHMGVPSITFRFDNPAPHPSSNTQDVDLDNSNSQSGWLSKLTNFKLPNIGFTKAFADYCVSTPSGQEAYKVTIEYDFKPEVRDDDCEPTAGLPCARFYPLVTFEYISDQKFDIPDETKAANLNGMLVYHRFHFRENNDPRQIIGLVQDCDEIVDINTIGKPNVCSPAAFPVSFKGTTNPVRHESYIPLFNTGAAPKRTVGNGTLLGYDWGKGFPDNFHQTGQKEVSLPCPFNNEDFSIAGCPTCVHDHWRWTGALSIDDLGTFGGRHIVGLNYYNNKTLGSDYHYFGSPLYDSGNLMVGNAVIIKYKPEEFNSLTPSLISRELIAPEVEFNNNAIPPRGDDIVFWNTYQMQRARIKLDGGVWKFKEMFHAHGGFFQPVRAPRNKELNVLRTAPPPSDLGYPIKVIAENYFRTLSTNIIEQVAGTPFHINVDLPSGYEYQTGTLYKLSVFGTPGIENIFSFEQATSGKQIVRYKVPNPNVPFSSIRLLHSETDDVNTHIRRWMDRTILSGPYAPDPINRIVSAEVSVLGSFLLAKLNPATSQPEPLAPTDLKLIGNVSPSPVPSGSDATYTFTISNQGSAVAEDVVLKQYLDSTTNLESAVASSGFCHTGDGHPITTLHESTSSNVLFCKVGDLQPGGSATVTVVVGTTVFGDGIDTTSIPISSDVMVFPKATDTNPSDNDITATFNALPSTNKPPTVSINNLNTGDRFVTSVENPVSIPITIAAADLDGSISEVKVYDTGNAVGTATSNGGGTYTYNFSTTQTGYHTITASAKDNGGRINTTGPIRILINSPHTVSIVNPTQSLIAPGGSLNIEITSNLPGNRVQKVEIYDRDVLLGNLRAVSNTGNLYKYRFTLNNVPRGRHSLKAILTDLTGAKTISESFDFKATIVPTVSITSPNNSQVFASGSSVDITAQVADGDGYVREVKFYANGKLIGSKTESIESGSTTLNWRTPDDGIYSIVAVATDDTDESKTSAPVNIGINRPSPTIGELVWMDDAIPE